MSDLRKEKGLLSAFRILVEKKPEEESRVQTEAGKLAAFLLKIPRQGKSVLHEQSAFLSDGMYVNVVLCNTANATSLKGLLSAKHRADRVDVHVTGGRGSQSNYNATLNFRDRELAFVEYVGQVRRLSVCKSGVPEEGYLASKDGKKVPFDSNLKKYVYNKTAEIFQKARTALTQSSV